MAKSKLSVKSAEKIAPYKEEKCAPGAAPDVIESDAGKAQKAQKAAKGSRRTRLLLLAALVAFAAAGAWVALNSNKPVFSRQAAEHIAEKVQGTTAPVVIRPEIDTRVAVVANAVVLSDEQKEEKAQEYIIAGVDFLKAGKPDLALSEFNSAIALFPAFAPAYVYRGEALFMKTDLAGAMDSFLAAIKLDENLSMAWFDLSVLQVKLGDMPSAMESINAAIAAYTAYPDANQNIFADELYRKRAQLNLWNKNFSDAIRDYTMASSFAKNVGRLDFPDIAGRADAKMGMGDFQGAVRDFDEVIRSVASVIGQMDDEEEKAASATIAMEAFEKRAAIKLKLGDLDGAKDDLRGAILLADAIGDGERRDALETALAQL
ncbi:MAG: tetratricopeptide repeat protein [Rickettsiales bacterium]|jgi:tetratricopeptide (TPR) repeat protein|nr:tetratricopeptide repeat protein [Rickettsiales bacterium]